MMRPRTIDESDMKLLEGLLNGTIEAADFAELEEKLENSAPLRQTYRELSDLELGLRQQAATASDSATLDYLAASQVVAPGPKPIAFYLLAAAAAAIIIFGLSAVIYNQRQLPAKPINTVAAAPGLPSVATLESPAVPILVDFDSRIQQGQVATIRSMRGMVTLTPRDQPPAAAANGQYVDNGTTVSTVKGVGTATVDLDDGSRFHLASGTELTIFRKDGQYQLFLGVGHLSVFAVPQQPDKPMRLITRSTTVTVVGTRFSLTSTSRTMPVGSDRHQTRLIVLEGHIRLDQEDGTTLEVRADEMAVIGNQEKTEKSSIADLRTSKIDIIRASYGTKEGQLDFTETLRSRLGPYRIIPLGFFNDPQGDPHRGEPKTLFVEYAINGQRHQQSFAECAILGKADNITYVHHTSITLPPPEK